MIQISESAQTHFRKLIERESLPGLGVKLSAVHPGTAKADVRLEFAEPADLGGTAVFLASRASDYVNGAVIPVDGGWLAR